MLIIDEKQGKWVLVIKNQEWNIDVIKHGYQRC